MKKTPPPSSRSIIPNKPCRQPSSAAARPRKGKRLGHAGAIISGNFGTPESKVKAFEAAGVPVADRPSQIPALLKERFAIHA